MNPGTHLVLAHVVVIHAVVLHAAAVHATASRQVCDEVQGDAVPDCDSRALPVHRLILLHVARVLAAILLPRRPDISVVTPTWQRHALLTGRCVPSVQAQDCPAAEHLIVCDGPDPDLPLIAGTTPLMLTEHRVALNRGLAARQFGAQAARGDLIAYLDDDNAWRRGHLGLLADALAASGADFAYSRAFCRNGAGHGYYIGAALPAFGEIDTSLIVHRRELLGRADWQPSRGPADWDLVRRWLDRGARWTFVPEVTLDYYLRA